MLLSATFCVAAAAVGAKPIVNSTKTEAQQSDYLVTWYKGVALLNLRKYKESIVYFDKALAINPDSVDALNSKGRALLKMGNNNGSIPYFDKALAINPKYIYGLYGKGDALLNMGKYKESIVYFDKALAIDPTSTFALAGKKLDLAGLSKTNIISNHTGRTAQQQHQPGA